MNSLPPPIAEPISLEQARLQCSIDAGITVWDELLNVYIIAAREFAEEYTGTAIGARDSLMVQLTTFPANGGAITLPEWPVLGVSSIDYVDKDGNLLFMPQGDYLLNANVKPRTVILASGAAWPADSGGATNNITVTYTSGYSLPNDSPQDSPLPGAIKVAMLLLIAYWFKQRESVSDKPLAEIPLGVCTLLDTQRIRLGFA